MCLTFESVLRNRRSVGERALLWLGTFLESVAGGFHERLEQRRSLRRLTPGPRGPRADLILQDFRVAARSLRRRPGLAGAVVITLALGIGANSAIFSLIDGVLLHPVDVPRPDEVVAAFHRLNERTPYEAFPYPLFRQLEADTRSLQGIGGFHYMDIGVRFGDRVEQVPIAGVSGKYFDLLGVRPQKGRLLASIDEGPPGANPVVVLSDEVWTRIYDRRSDAVGSTIHASGIGYTVVGVAPKRFRGTDLSASPQLWFPITMSTSLGEGGLFSSRTDVFTTTAFGWVEVVGRLRPDVSPTAAARELNTRTTAYWQSLGAGRAAGRDSMIAPVSVLTIAGGAALGERDSLVRFVIILSSVVVLTLLIACVNVANLMIIRGTERSRELAVRAALGASRVRLGRQVLLESVILSVLGAVVATGVGLSTTRLLAAFALPGGIALNSIPLGLNPRVLVFTTVCGALAAIAFGSAPAIRAGHLGHTAMLGTHGRASTRAARGYLVMAQTAMSVLLLIGAGLFIRSLRAGLGTDLGIDPRNLAAATVEVGLHGYTPEAKVAFYTEAIERALAIPGVTGAAMGSQVPLSRLNRLPFTPAGGDRQSPRVPAGLVHVSPEYFDVLSVPLVAGRKFTTADDANAPRVAIVNESAAQLLAPGNDILGRDVTLLGTIRYTIVGIARDTKYASVRDTGVPVLFVPFTQPSSGSMSLIVRSASPRAVLPSLTQVLRALDANIPVRDVRLVANQVHTVLMPQRFGAMLLGLLAAVALCISAVGIYGVVANGVSNRVRELGIRLALGARRKHIVRVVAWRTAVGIGAGMLLGVGAAGVASRGLEGFLFGVTHLDFVAFLGAAIVLAVAGAVACWIPIRRALRVDPMSVIRQE
jgi:predicted permease